jgi:3-methyladenine DNA glycosylase AlkD
MLSKLKKELEGLADKKRTEASLRYFKTAPGQYGHGDKFLGLNSANQRQLAKKYFALSFPDLQKLLDSQWHEYRAISLLILMQQYRKADAKKQTAIFNFYLKNKERINNWDLVDISCPHIVGLYLLDKPKERKVLLDLAKSEHLWSKRIALISTFAFIRHDDFYYSLKIAKLLLSDQHDLIHKALGWTLREIGKRDLATEKEFLKQNFSKLPRTALRYAIEKFSEKTRQRYLKKKI